MMGPHDIGAYIASAIALTPASLVAGAGDDGEEVNGPTIDRLALGSIYLSCKVVITYSAVLAADETLTITANVQDDTADDFSDAPADLSPAYPETVVGTGDDTISGMITLDIPLDMARQYIRLQCTADLSAADTDTAVVSAVFVFGGGQIYPAT